MLDYTNASRFGVCYGNDTMKVKCGVKSKIDFYDVNGTRELVGTIVIDTKIRDGKFQLIAFEPENYKGAIIPLYLNGAANVWKTYAPNGHIWENFFKELDEEDFRCNMVEFCNALQKFQVLSNKYKLLDFTDM